MASLTIENYVKAIYQLCSAESQQPAATGRLATALAVSPGTVTSMLKTLSEGGLAVYTPYEGVRLTAAGQALALRVLRRHRLIELFLFRTLAIPWDEVHAEAENLEHAASDHLVDRIDQFLGFPTNDPHGDPIPRSDGTLPDHAARSLTQWEVPRPFRLVRVLDQSPEFLRFLTESGLSVGATGSIRQSHPEAGVIVVQLANSTATISQQVADKLLVEECL